jgi:hypothetical protein
MHLTQSLVLHLLSATIASAVAIESNVLDEDGAVVSLDPPKPKSPPPKASNPPTKGNQYPLGTNPFALKKATEANWANWSKYCKGYTSLTRTELNGIWGRLPWRQIILGPASASSLQARPIPPASNAIFWHMSGTVLMLSQGWDQVIKIINSLVLRICGRLERRLASYSGRT